jgi:hypothetical protein
MRQFSHPEHSVKAANPYHDQRQLKSAEATLWPLGTLGACFRAVFLHSSLALSSDLEIAFCMHAWHIHIFFRKMCRVLPKCLLSCLKHPEFSEINRESRYRQLHVQEYEMVAYVIRMAGILSSYMLQYMQL